MPGTRKYGPFTGGKRKLIGTVHEEAQALELLDKDFKSTVLNLPKELKETMDKN